MSHFAQARRVADLTVTFEDGQQESFQGRDAARRFRSQPVQITDDIEPDDLVLFYTEAQNVLDRCRSALRDGLRDHALEEFRRGVHTLRGSAGYLGYADMRALGDFLETVARGIERGSISVTGPLLQAMTAAIERLADLNKALDNGELAADGIPPVLAEVLRQVLDPN